MPINSIRPGFKGLIRMESANTPKHRRSVTFINTNDIKKIVRGYNEDYILFTSDKEYKLCDIGEKHIIGAIKTAKKTETDYNADIPTLYYIV